MKKIVLIMMTIMLFATLQPFSVGVEAGRAVIGYIDAYTGPADHYAIIRDNAEVEDGVGIWVELLDGDRIRVKQAGQTFTVRYTDGTRETFGAEVGVFGPLELRGDDSTVLGNLMASLAGAFSDLREHRVETVATYTRGDGALTLEPVFSSGDTVLVEGRRDLYLSWRDGETPFSVVITREDSDTPAFRVAGIEAQSWRIEQIDLTPGTYRVEIAGAGNAVAFPLQVVDAQYRPGVAPSCRDAAVSDELQTLTHAYCLASIDDGLWAFEAYQLLMPVANSGYPPAELLLDGLRAGEYRNWAPPEPVAR